MVWALQQVFVQDAEYFFKRKNLIKQWIVSVNFGKDKTCKEDRNITHILYRTETEPSFIHCLPVTGAKDHMWDDKKNIWN